MTQSYLKNIYLVQRKNKNGYLIIYQQKRELYHMKVSLDMIL